MRRILTAISLAIAVASFSQQQISGRLIDSTTKQPLAGARITLFKINTIKTGGSYGLSDTSWKSVNRVYTDSFGFYRLNKVDTGFYKVSAFFAVKKEYGRETGEYSSSGLFLLSKSQNRQIDFQLGVFCVYDLTKDLVECPNCHKKEGVRIQLYGMPADLDNSLEDDGKHYYNGYCIVKRCQATKICLLCKAEF